MCFYGIVVAAFSKAVLPLGKLSERDRVSSPRLFLLSECSSDTHFVGIFRRVVLITIFFHRQENVIGAKAVTVLKIAVSFQVGDLFLRCCDVSASGMERPLDFSSCGECAETQKHKHTHTLERRRIVFCR